MTQFINVAIVLVVGLTLGTVCGYGLASARYDTQIPNLQNEANSLMSEIVSRNSMLNSSYQREANVSRLLSLAQSQVSQLSLQVQISQGKASFLESDAMNFRNLAPIRYSHITDRHVVYYDKFLLTVTTAWWTGSMGNTIGCNDVAILSKPGPSEIDKGSIIVFKP